MVRDVPLTGESLDRVLASESEIHHRFRWYMRVNRQPQHFRYPDYIVMKRSESFCAHPELFVGAAHCIYVPFQLPIPLHHLRLVLTCRAFRSLPACPGSEAEETRRPSQSGADASHR
jgi:hypothetical protein